MKEEWKVYIKSVSGRGDEVIKMLEDLGAKNSFDYEGNKLEALYYIWHDGSIHVELIDNEYGQIIMDNYRELKLPEKWKDGDLIVCHMLSGNKYAVYSDDSELMTFNNIITYADVDNHTYGVNGLFDKEDFTLASDKEHKEFHELLFKHGVDWDAEKKQLVDWRWKPKEGELYFFISSSLYVDSTSNDGLKLDVNRIRCGNCFHTREEAEAMAERIKKLLKGE